MFDEKKINDQDKAVVIPLLPLRDVVMFPHMIVPLFVGREKSIAALESAMKYEKSIFMVAQKNAKDDDPKQEDIIVLARLALSFNFYVCLMGRSRSLLKEKLVES